MKKQFLPCLCMNARRAAGSITAFYDRELEETGITVSQYSLMINIERLGSTNITDLTRVVNLEKSTLTRTLAPLIEKGYIKSERSEKNRREVILALTDRGNEVTKKAFPIWKEIQSCITELLGGEEEAWDFMDKLKMLQKLKYMEQE